MTQAAKNKLSLSRNPSAPWSQFAQRLATALSKLLENQYLILSVKRSNRFVQFACQGASGLRVETTSNSYLSGREQLGEEQISQLLAAGWNAPTGTPTESTPEDDLNGSPNFFVDFTAPVRFEAVANLAVCTLAEIMRVPNPMRLKCSAFDNDGGEIALPELRLKPAKCTPRDDTATEVPDLQEGETIVFYFP